MKGWQIGLLVGGGLGIVAAVASSSTSNPNEGGGEPEGGGGGESGGPPMPGKVPFGKGGEDPLWPLIKSAHPRRFEVPYVDEDGKWHGNRSRAFGVNRPWGKGDAAERWHAGVDLYANGEDIIVAPEAGIVVGRQTLYKGTGALMLALDSGVNILFGETLMGGAAEFGIDVDTRVERGQPLTRVGWHDEDAGEPGIQGGAHMLHLEMYEPGIIRNKQWPKSGGIPAGLLDPTEYLLRARAAATAVA